jgi:phenylacetate-CoA ligase
VNVRAWLYFGAHRLVGKNRGAMYAAYRREDQVGVPEGTTRQLLSRLLAHCAEAVPYYAEIMARRGEAYKQSPEAYLAQFPILTKGLLTRHFEQLKSQDLGRRRWRYESSGGSTGEPVRVIQDQACWDSQAALEDLGLYWAGREVGEPMVSLWGSERDLQGNMGLKMRALNRLANTTLLNAYHMTPERMQAYLDWLNVKRPKVIVAYAQAIYDLAQFAENAGVAVTPQAAILTSASTLHPFMREKIEKVFGCRVFDRYGCREVGSIACECPHHAGLHVFPWGNYIEIVDEKGRPVPPGVEGNILVTSLTNYAMPLIRYQMGDRGSLAADANCPCGRNGQWLQRITGRLTDDFRTRAGRLVPGIYFVHMIGVALNTGTIKKFQVIQEDYEHLHLFLVKRDPEVEVNLPAIRAAFELAMGAGLQLDVDYVEDIPPGPSGKYRYTISRVQP